MPKKETADYIAVEKNTDEIGRLNSLLKILTNNACTYSLVLDHDTKILYYSESLLSLAGIKNYETFIGMPLLDAYEIIFNDRGFIEEASRRLSRVMSGENDFFEDDTVVWPDGQKRIYRLSYKKSLKA